MNVLIRRMTLDDLAVVIPLDQISFSLPWPERSFRFELTENLASRCWVAEVDERVVAMLVGWLLVDEPHIATIATHPDFRRQGIGARILAQAILDARAFGARLAFLEVRASNEVAQAMYRKFGFQTSGRRPKYYRDNGEDAILMTLQPLEIKWMHSKY